MDKQKQLKDNIIKQEREGIKSIVCDVEEADKQKRELKGGDKS